MTQPTIQSLFHSSKQPIIRNSVVGKRNFYRDIHLFKNKTEYIRFRCVSLHCRSNWLMRRTWHFKLNQPAYFALFLILWDQKEMHTLGGKYASRGRAWSNVSKAGRKKEFSISEVWILNVSRMKSKNRQQFTFNNERKPIVVSAHI